MNNKSLGSYGYDGNGKRVKKTEGAATTYYVYSSVLGSAVLEVAAAGVQRAYVISGNSVVAQLNPNGNFYWLHVDHLGSGRKMTDTSGAVVYRAEYEPYGKLTYEWSSTSNLNTKKFTGYERDAATGLDYAQARMYASDWGRFMSPDPKGLGSANSHSPQSFNRYSYTDNNPVNRVDPDGQEWIAIGQSCVQSFWTYGGTNYYIKTCTITMIFIPEPPRPSVSVFQRPQQPPVTPPARPIGPIVGTPPQSTVPLSVQAAQGLRGLSTKCKETFGLTDGVISQMASSANLIDLRDPSNNRIEMTDVDGIFLGEARPFWNQRIAPFAPNAIAVAIGTQNGYRINTVLIAPGADDILKAVNWDWGVVLAHELLHIKTNLNDIDLAKEYRLTYKDSNGRDSPFVASTEFQNFLMNGCGESPPPPR